MFKNLLRGKTPPAPTGAGNDRMAAKELATKICADNEEAKQICRDIWSDPQYRLDGLKRIAAVPHLRGIALVQEVAARGGITKTMAWLAGLGSTPEDIAKSLAAASTDSEADKLAAECCQVRVSWQWFRTGSKVDKADKLMMADAASTTEAGFSASKRLMDSKHPVIKEANETRGRIQAFIRGMSLPVVRVGGADGQVKKDGGNYLVRWNDITTFNQRMLASQSELVTLEEKVNRSLTSIKEMDKARLGKLYKEADYPTAVRLRVFYQTVPFEPSAQLERHDPGFYESEKQRVRQLFGAVYTNSVGEFMTQFHAVISDWVGATGPVITLHPPTDHPFSIYGEADVVRRLSHEDDATIPAGKFRLMLHYKDPLKGADAKWDDVTTAPMTQAEYAALQPSEAPDKCRRFQPSTIENLQEVISKFNRLADTISAGTGFKEAAAQILTQIKRLGDTPDKIGKELRTSTTLRNETHALMETLDRQLAKEITTFQTKRRAVVFVGEKKWDDSDEPTGK